MTPSDESPGILVLNPGSSTLKFSLYAASEDAAAPPVVRTTGIVDRLGTAEAELRLDADKQPPVREAVQALSPGQAAETVLRRLQAGGPAGGGGLTGLGCRVVHGGERFSEPARVTPEVLAAIRELGALAPLHNPVAADVLEVCLRLLPDVPVVAVFDTAFHRTLPQVASAYALPRDLSERMGLRRYGFHGIAHRYVSERLIERIGKTGQSSRCVTCHLGSGASVCAVKDGRSIDTSMGLTPMEGLVMGTRSGDVDPGLLLHLLRAENLTPDDLDDLLNRQSGLLGLSGRSNDLRDLQQAASEGDEASELAMEVFAYRVAKTIGAYAVALEGLDGVAFSGGIGEHSAPMRARICRRLAFLGLALDAARNEAADGRDEARVSADGAPVQVWVIPADEGAQIAREVRAVV